MSTARPQSVAVLLATCNGEPFVRQQVASLKDNTHPFTLHWLDDLSVDRTREEVRRAADDAAIELREWHNTARQNVPGAFFRLLEQVEADYYLFCDQDDIWQPGKIDATLAALRPRAGLPALCYSEPRLFRTDAPGVLQPYYEAIQAERHALQAVSRSFFVNPAVGNTMGFTRELREIFLAHRAIASSHAAMHDFWMYLIGLASGSVEMLPDAPTTLYRQHAANAVGVWVRRGERRWAATWGHYRFVRRVCARQAAGFILAAGSLPESPRREQLLAYARLAARVDERVGPLGLIQLAHNRIFPRRWRTAAWLALSCLLGDARESAVLP